MDIHEHVREAIEYEKNPLSIKEEEGKNDSTM